jgi:cysteine-S-conjugate beta-lyase
MGKRTGKQRDLTRLGHVGRDPALQHGFVNMPIYRGSTVLFPTLAALESNDQDFTYGRLGTPTVRALEEAIAELEGGHRTLLTPSGLSAIVTALLAFVSAGDEVLIADSVYRPNRRFCDNVLKRLGVTITYYDPLIGAGIDKLITKKTKVGDAALFQAVCPWRRRVDPVGDQIYRRPCRYHARRRNHDREGHGGRRQDA